MQVTKQFNTCRIRQLSKFGFLKSTQNSKINWLYHTEIVLSKFTITVKDLLQVLPGFPINTAIPMFALNYFYCIHFQKKILLLFNHSLYIKSIITNYTLYNLYSDWSSHLQISLVKSQELCAAYLITNERVFVLRQRSRFEPLTHILRCPVIHIVC